jgi:hypothetical protein
MIWYIGLFDPYEYDVTASPNVREMQKRRNKWFAPDRRQVNADRCGQDMRSGTNHAV